MINEIHEQEWYDFPACHSALEEAGRVYIKSPTRFERRRQPMMHFQIHRYLHQLKRAGSAVLADRPGSFESGKTMDLGIPDGFLDSPALYSLLPYLFLFLQQPGPTCLGYSGSLK